MIHEAKTRLALITLVLVGPRSLHQHTTAPPEGGTWHSTWHLQQQMDWSLLQTPHFTNQKCGLPPQGCSRGCGHGSCNWHYHRPHKHALDDHFARSWAGQIPPETYIESTRQIFRCLSALIPFQIPFATVKRTHHCSATIPDLALRTLGCVHFANETIWRRVLRVLKPNEMGVYLQDLPSLALTVVDIWYLMTRVPGLRHWTTLVRTMWMI